MRKSEMSPVCNLLFSRLTPDEKQYLKTRYESIYYFCLGKKEEYSTFMHKAALVNMVKVVEMCNGGEVE